MPAPETTPIVAPTSRPLIVLLLEALCRHARRPLLHAPGREGEAGRSLSGGELILLAARVAQGLRALGLRTGEPVLLWSENRDRWLAADLALLALGCPDAPRGADAPADEIAYIVERIRARIAFVERPQLLEKLRSGRGGIEVAILLAGAAPKEGPRGIRTLAFEELLALAPQQRALADFEAAAAERRLDEVATVVFTSGTTGRPKGVVLTQGNLASNLEQVLTVIGFLKPGGTILSILPPWHMFERMVEYALLALGLRVVYSERRHFARDLAAFRPEVLAAVPRLWLLLMEGVRAKLAKAPERRRRRLEGALELAETRARARRFGGPGPSWRELVRRPLRALLAPVVARGIARALGVDRLRRGIAISGGGTLPDHVDVFFAALGIEILNGYGLTETSPVLTLRLPWRNAAGTVGPPLPRTEIAVRDPEIGERLPPGRRGVIHARGPQVMRGYFEDARATDAVLAPEGWFDTGDLGELTQAGDLRITGRAKDTIVLLSGENVEPEPIENALVSSPLIEQAVVVGQDRKQLGALVVPRRRDEPGALAGRELLSALRREIDELVSPRRGFRSHERIVRFRVLERPLTLEDGFLSQTLKVKRGVVLERMAAEIDALYRDEASQA